MFSATILLSILNTICYLLTLTLVIKKIIKLCKFVFKRCFKNRNAGVNFSKLDKRNKEILKNWEKEKKNISIILYRTYKALSRKDNANDFDMLRELILREEYRRLNGFAYDLKHIYRYLNLYNYLSEESKTIMDQYIYFNIDYTKLIKKCLILEKNKFSSLNKRDILTGRDIVIIHPKNLNTIQDVKNQINALKHFDLMNFVPPKSKLFTNSYYKKRHNNSFYTDEIGCNKKYNFYTNFDSQSVNSNGLECGGNDCIVEIGDNNVNNHEACVEENWDTKSDLGLNRTNDDYSISNQNNCVLDIDHHNHGDEDIIKQNDNEKSKSNQ